MPEGVAATDGGGCGRRVASSNVLFQNTHILLIHFSKLKHYTIYIFKFSLTVSIMLNVVGVVIVGVVVVVY